MTAQLPASITMSAVCPVPPISAMRSSRISRLPRTMELRLSIVTSVPFFIRTDDIPKQFTPQKGPQKAQNAQKAQRRRILFVPYVLFVPFCGLLCGGLYVRGFGFLTNWKTELHL